MTCRISSCPLKYISQGLLDLLESSTPVGVQGWKVSGWRGKTLVKNPIGNTLKERKPCLNTLAMATDSGSDSKVVRRVIIMGTKTIFRSVPERSRHGDVLVLIV